MGEKMNPYPAYLTSEYDRDGDVMISKTEAENAFDAIHPDASPEERKYMLGKLWKHDANKDGFIDVSSTFYCTGIGVLTTLYSLLLQVEELIMHFWEFIDDENANADAEAEEQAAKKEAEGSGPDANDAENAQSGDQAAPTRSLSDDPADDFDL
jgi:hypothetical protein